MAGTGRVLIAAWIDRRIGDSRHKT